MPGRFESIKPLSLFHVGRSRRGPEGEIYVRTIVTLAR